MKGSSKPDTEQFLNYVKEHQHDLEGKHTVEQMFIDFKEKLAFDKQQIKNAKRIQKIQDKMKEPTPKEQEKALKEKEKADKKALKEKEKADKKAEKEREKAYKKSLKEQEKAHKKATKKEEPEEDDTLHPWAFKGKTYLKNIYNEVYLRGYKGGVGEWVGVFDGEKIDKTIPEPEYDEPAVPEPETDPALDKKSKIEPEDDMLYPWAFKGKTYLKNIYNEVYLRGYKGGVGKWVGIFDGEKIDDTIPEPEYDEPAVPEPETDPALDKKSKIEPEKPSKYLTRLTWLDAKGKKVKFMYNGKKETGTLLFWQHPKLVQRVPGPLGVRGAYDEHITAVVRLPTESKNDFNEPIFVPVFEGLKNVAKMKLV
jgi:hypothetical protein